MKNSNNEIIQFQRFARLDGSTEAVSLIRRNGFPEMQFPSAGFEFPLYYEAEENLDEYQETLDEVCQNLNEIERRTWLKIIDGRSILDIAEEEDVSRPAIYDRIRRMVKKNDYCAIWWRLKHNKINQHK